MDNDVDGFERLRDPVLAGPAAALSLPFVEGGFTPAEIAAAAAHGPAKVFPAHVGGPAYVRSLLAVFPDAVLIPTGGVRLDDVAAYRAAGALAVGVGSDLVRHGDLAGRLECLRRSP